MRIVATATRPSIDGAIGRVAAAQDHDRARRPRGADTGRKRESLTASRGGPYPQSWTVGPWLTGTPWKVRESPSSSRPSPGKRRPEGPLRHRSITLRSWRHRRRHRHPSQAAVASLGCAMLTADQVQGNVAVMLSGKPCDMMGTAPAALTLQHVVPDAGGVAADATYRSIRAPMKFIDQHAASHARGDNEEHPSESR